MTTQRILVASFQTLLLLLLLIKSNDFYKCFATLNAVVYFDHLKTDKLLEKRDSVDYWIPENQYVTNTLLDRFYPACKFGKFPKSAPAYLVWFLKLFWRVFSSSNCFQTLHDGIILKLIKKIRYLVSNFYINLLNFCHTQSTLLQNIRT